MADMQTDYRHVWKRGWLLVGVLLGLVHGCAPSGPPPGLVPTILTRGSIACGCDAACLFEVEGTLGRPLEESEALYLVVRPTDDGGERYYLQFGETAINGTFWTAEGQAGSADFPPAEGDTLEVAAIVVVNTSAAELPSEPVDAISPAAIPGLVYVGNTQRLTVACGDEDADGSEADRKKQDVLDALTVHTYWHLYSPARTEAGAPVSEAQIRDELQRIYDSGGRGLVTYEMMNGVEAAPCIAKQIGFTWVLAGIYWYTQGVDRGQADSSLDQEQAAIAEHAVCIDGIVVGNEGLLASGVWNQPRYTVADLERELRAMIEAYPEKVVTAAEGKDTYEAYPQLVSDATLTDFVFPNLHPYWGLGGTPGGNPDDLATFHAVNWVVTVIGSEPFSLRGDRPIVMHESWWPARFGDFSQETGQVAFFQGLLDAGVPFCWGETVDQPWKAAGLEGSIGEDWGLWHYDAGLGLYQEKAVVDLVEARSR
jgi:exo-beta-1,3-glucanase (GH17 family)